MTYFDAQRALVRETQVDIEVSRVGKLKMFGYRGRVKVGQGHGQKIGGSYVYDVADDVFVELQGVQPGGRTSPAMFILVWKKQSSGDSIP